LSELLQIGLTLKRFRCLFKSLRKFFPGDFDENLYIIQETEADRTEPLIFAYVSEQVRERKEVDCELVTKLIGLGFDINTRYGCADPMNALEYVFTYQGSSNSFYKFLVE
jgi:hypothetical protein